MGVLSLIGISLAGAVMLTVLPMASIALALVAVRAGSKAIGWAVSWRTTYAIGALASAVAYKSYLSDKEGTDVMVLPAAFVGGGVLAGVFRLIDKVV